ncbi:uncharacterized protein V6R79_006914 [Siganus canaliculatus]
MELPLGGPALRHYTQSRPRPHRQKLNYRPSRPQETIIESENEVPEFMGRVDEGVEEFFTKKVLPTETLKKPDEESITVLDVAPASSVPCPPQTKTLRRKLGDFFTLKKKRGLKSEPSQEGRPKKASIADFIRPLREVGRADKDKDKDRVKELDKENEKEKAKEQPSAGTGESAAQETPAPPLRAEVVPPRRALREGKSQSLILLSGSAAAAGTANARNTAKKQFEGQHSFEQKLHLMLQRIGVSKAQPGETQSQEGEMKKAESEGTIIDSKPEPQPTFTKPRTMSASSDTRHQIRPSVSAHESAGKPALLPKPVLKPGPPPTTSGRNTPENELGQIEEGETTTPTKPSPAAAQADLAAPTTPTVLTISNSVTDSQTSLSSTVPPSDADTSSDAVSVPATTTTLANVTEPDSKACIPDTNVGTAEPPAATSSSPALTSTTTPSEPTTTVLVTSLESITPSLSVTSTSTTITTPSITTAEAALAPKNEGLVATTSSSQSSDLPVPEPNVTLSADFTPTSGAPTSVVTTASPPSTTVSDMSTTTSSVSEVSDGSPSITSASSVPLASSVTNTTSPASDASGAITSSSSLLSSALPLTSATSSTAATTSPSSADCMDSISTSIVTHPASPSSADSSVPSTSSSETNLTNPMTTAASLTHADTCTTSSETAATISSPPLTESDPSSTNDVSTSHIPANSGVPTAVNATATAQHLTSPEISNDGEGRNKDLQTSPGPTVEPTKKEAEEKLDLIEKSKQTEMGESKKVEDGGKKGANEKDKPALASSEAIRKEMQEEGVKPGEDTVKTDVETAEPASGKAVKLRSDEIVKEGQKQEETKSVGEK